jgi:hypothetical protein
MAGSIMPVLSTLTTAAVHNTKSDSSRGACSPVDILRPCSQNIGLPVKSLSEDTDIIQDLASRLQVRADFLVFVLKAREGLVQPAPLTAKLVNALLKHGGHVRRAIKEAGTSQSTYTRWRIQIEESFSFPKYYMNIGWRLLAYAVQQPSCMLAEPGGSASPAGQILMFKAPLETVEILVTQARSVLSRILRGDAALRFEMQRREVRGFLHIQALMQSRMDRDAAAKLRQLPRARLVAYISQLAKRQEVPLIAAVMEQVCGAKPEMCLPLKDRDGADLSDLSDAKWLGLFDALAPRPPPRSRRFFKRALPFQNCREPPAPEEGALKLAAQSADVLRCLAQGTPGASQVTPRALRQALLVQSLLETHGNLKAACRISGMDQAVARHEVRCLEQSSAVRSLPQQLKLLAAQTDETRRAQGTHAYFDVDELSLAALKARLEEINFPQAALGPKLPLICAGVDKLAVTPEGAVLEALKRADQLLLKYASLAAGAPGAAPQAILYDDMLHAIIMRLLFEEQGNRAAVTKRLCTKLALSGNTVRAAGFLSRKQLNLLLAQIDQWLGLPLSPALFKRVACLASVTLRKFGDVFYLPYISAVLALHALEIAVGELKRASELCGLPASEIRQAARILRKKITRGR